MVAPSEHSNFAKWQELPFESLTAQQNKLTYFILQEKSVIKQRTENTEDPEYIKGQYKKVGNSSLFPLFM